MKLAKTLNISVIIAAAFLVSLAYQFPEHFSNAQITTLLLVQAMALLFIVESKKKLIWPLAVAMLACSQASHAEFLVRFDLDKEAVRFNAQETEPQKSAKELCDDRVLPAINSLAMKFPETSYRSHSFSKMEMPGGMIGDNCSVSVVIPSSRSVCVGSNDYAVAVSDLLTGLGFDSVEFDYVGGCN